MVRILLLGALLFSSSIFAQSLDLRSAPSGYMNDYTKTLTREEVNALNQKLTEFEKQTSNQIFVLMIPSLYDESIEDFTIKQASQWRIGQKNRDNGVLLFIAKNDHKMRIEVGYGLEGALPDALAGTIIRNEIAPAFQAGNYNEGINKGVQAIMLATKGEYHPEDTKTGEAIIFFVFVGVLILVYIFRNRFPKAPPSTRNLDCSGASSTPERKENFPKGGGGTFGGGGASGGW